jgi:anaerobic magnesium-protoporphyrin IX monomethyl ester cyclase
VEPTFGHVRVKARKTGREIKNIFPENDVFKEIAAEEGIPRCLMMKVLLVKPPERSMFNFGSFSLAVLAAALEDIASVRIIDATTMGIGDVVREILGESPDLVGITAMGPSSVQPVIDQVRGLRDAGFSGLVVAGGHGATMYPAPLLAGGAEVIVLGEGEETLRDIVLHGISAQVDGISFLEGSDIFTTAPRALINPLDLLKPPARHLIASPPDGIFLLETSRGCPHGCAFCETTRFYGRRWRARSPEIVARNIWSLVESGALMIQIADDNFTASPDRVIKICRLLQDGPLPLFMIFFARSDDIVRVPELSGHLASANFLRVSVGVETTNPSLLRVIQKEIPFEKHKKAFKLMANAGIFSIASLIIGLPGETTEMREEYVEKVVELGADSVYFLPFQPLPGTPLGTKTGEPDPEIVKEAARLTSEFESHPVVLRRLADLASEPTVRGMLARASIERRSSKGVGRK